MDTKFLFNQEENEYEDKRLEEWRQAVYKTSDCCIKCKKVDFEKQAQHGFFCCLFVQ